jgi:hypothetical protein
MIDARTTKIILTRLRLDSRIAEDELTKELKTEFPSLSDQTIRDNISKTIQSCVLRRAGILHPNVLTEKGIHPYFLFIAVMCFASCRNSSS